MITRSFVPVTAVTVECRLQMNVKFKRRKIQHHDASSSTSAPLPAPLPHFTYQLSQPWTRGSTITPLKVTSS
jgi:hypothetical protein